MKRSLVHGKKIKWKIGIYPVRNSIQLKQLSRTHYERQAYQQCNHGSPANCRSNDIFSFTWDKQITVGVKVRTRFPRTSAPLYSRIKQKLCTFLCQKYQQSEIQFQPNCYAQILTRQTGQASIGNGTVNLSMRVTLSKFLKIFSDNCRELKFLSQKE